MSLRSTQQEMFFTLEQSKQALGIDDRKIRLIGVPLISLSTCTFYKTIPVDFPTGIIGFSMMLLVFFSHTVVYWEGNRALFIYLRRKFPRQQEVMKRLILQFALLVVNTSLLTILIEGLLQILVFKSDWEGIKNHFLIGFKLGLGYSTLVSVIYEAIYFYQMWKKSVTHSEMLLRQQVETQLESLKNQVNPHFLFNSLNTLTSLIPRNPDNAIKFVNKLSQVYRYVLEVNASQMIPLWQELQFMDAYLFLLKERHGEKLQVEMDIPEGFHNHKVISLVLQILLENAVKHNVVSQKKPLKVQVFVEDDALWVVNPLQPKSMPLPSTGLGLKNIAERYDLLAGEGMVIDQTETEFRVGVPLIQEKVEVYN